MLNVHHKYIIALKINVCVYVMEVGCVGGTRPVSFVLTMLCTALVYVHKLTQPRNAAS